MRREHTTNIGLPEGNSYYMDWKPISSITEWSVADEVNKPFYLRPYTTNSTITIKTTNKTPSILYSFNNSSWTTLPALTTTTAQTISMGSNTIIYFKCKTSAQAFNGVKFDCNTTFDVGGNILSLVYATNWNKPQNEITIEGNFSQMFMDNKLIRHAERLCLGSTSYGYAFDQNTAANVLPSFTDAAIIYKASKTCFMRMFKNSSLETAPLGLGAFRGCGVQSYYEMFFNCNKLRRCSRQVYAYNCQQQSFAYCFGSCHNVEFLPVGIYCTFGNAGKQIEGFLHSCWRIRYPDLDGSTFVFSRGDTTYNVPSEALRYMLSLDYSLDKAEIKLTGDSTTGIQSNGLGSFFESDKNLRVIRYIVSNTSSWMALSSHAKWVKGVRNGGRFEYYAPGTVSMATGTFAIPTGWTVVAIT